jgi:glutaredoxin
MSNTITMYGTATCSDCARSKKLLDEMGVAYDYVDLNADEKSAETALAISGRTSTPLVVFPDGTHVVEPTDSELRARVKESQQAAQ